MGGRKPSGLSTRPVGGYFAGAGAAGAGKVGAGTAGTAAGAGAAVCAAGCEAPRIRELGLLEAA